jgi:hypothetical protein
MTSPPFQIRKADHQVGDRVIGMPLHVSPSFGERLVIAPREKQDPGQDVSGIGRQRIELDRDPKLPDTFIPPTHEGKEVAVTAIELKVPGLSVLLLVSSAVVPGDNAASDRIDPPPKVSGPRTVPTSRPATFAASEEVCSCEPAPISGDTEPETVMFSCVASIPRIKVSAVTAPVVMTAALFAA